MMLYFLTIVTTSVISVVLLGLSFIMSYSSINNMMNRNPFECGFIGLEEGRSPFSLQFFLVTLIFLIFDIELIMLFPYLTIFTWKSHSTMIFMSLFILFLSFSLVWEWMKTMLEWTT